MPMKNRGKVERDKVRKDRRLWAEEIAATLELKSLGYQYSQISQYLFVTDEYLKNRTSQARKYGFDIMPKRSGGFESHIAYVSIVEKVKMLEVVR